MSVEERNALMERKKVANGTEVFDEQKAAETLFGLVGTIEMNAPPVVYAVNNQLDYVIEEAVNEIMDEHATTTAPCLENCPIVPEATVDEHATPTAPCLENCPIVPEATVHEIPTQNIVAEECEEFVVPPTKMDCDVIPVDDEVRERKEEEQVQRLKDKRCNTILNYTKRQQKGIQTTEKNNSRKRMAQPCAPSMQSRSEKCNNKKRKQTSNMEKKVNKTSIPKKISENNNLTKTKKQNKKVCGSTNFAV